MFKIEAAGKIICLDLPDEYIGTYMDRFAHGGTRRADVTVGAECGPLPDFVGSVPVHSVRTLSGDNFYAFSPFDYISHFRYNANCSDFLLNVNNENEFLPETVQSVLRRIFIMIAAESGGVCLHSSTVMLEGGAVCFSASSGTGKTTHTNLWKDFIPGIEIINGDMGYLLKDGGGYRYHSAPWCGTSGECMNRAVPLKAVVFLERSDENRIRKLSVPEAFMRLSARCFLPAWDGGLYVKSLAAAEDIAGGADCYLLECLPDIGAVKVCYHGIH